VAVKDKYDGSQRAVFMRSGRGDQRSAYMAIDADFPGLQIYRLAECLRRKTLAEKHDPKREREQR
jgi:hypothetical protein